MSLDLICMTHQIIAALATTCSTTRRVDYDPLVRYSPPARSRWRYTRGDQREDGGVARQDLRDHRGVEIGRKI